MGGSAAELTSKPSSLIEIVRATDPRPQDRSLLLSRFPIPVSRLVPNRKSPHAIT